MLEKIPIYELPFKLPEDSEFRFYKVRGKYITRDEYPHKTILPHKHNYYEICIFTGGTGEHEIDFKTYPILPPSIHVLYPGQVHLIHRGNFYKGYLMVFSREFFKLRFNNLEIIPGYPFLSKLPEGPVLNFNEKEFEDFSVIISCIEKEIQNIAPETLDIIVSFLNIFFLKLHSRFNKLLENTNTPPESSAVLTNTFCSLLENNFNKYHQVSEYADLLGVSTYTVNSSLKQYTGKTASELIQDRLILEAKRLLVFSEMSNKEIAYQLNYEDPSYFSRIFRKKTGSSPSDFRNEIKNRYKL